jgi:hypothetical protein
MAADLFPLHTCTRTLIPVDKDQLGGVKVGSNNLGGGECFRSHVYSCMALLATPAADVLAQNGNSTVLVNEDLYLWNNRKIQTQFVHLSIVLLYSTNSGNDISLLQC